MKRNVLEYLEHSAAINPNKTAVVDEEKSYTYQELLDLSQTIGSELSKKTNLRMPIAVLVEKSAETRPTLPGIRTSANLKRLFLRNKKKRQAFACLFLFWLKEP